MKKTQQYSSRYEAKPWIKLHVSLKQYFFLSNFLRYLRFILNFLPQCSQLDSKEAFNLSAHQNRHELSKGEKSGSANISKTCIT